MREGREFGPYRIEQHLGSGGMGDVYLAIDTRLGRQVALKFLPAELTSEEEMLHRFQEEARTASALNHPNILTIYDIGEIGGDYFIASEYIDGIDLRAALNERSIDAARAIEIAAQIASALAQAHKAGIVHRDLKPGNIMLRQDGYVKVIDFGLAKLVEAPARGGSRGSLTQPGSVLGTVHYMSPEQARGEELDRRSDLWSLGVILYEMAAHRRPFEGQTDSHVIVAILDQDAPPLPEGLGVPGGLAQVVQRALQKDPAKRYQSAGEFCAELRRLQTGASAERSMPLSVGTAPRDWGRRGALGGVALALLAVWAVWWWGLGGRYRFTSPEWFQFETPERITYDGNVQLGAISPDGKYLAYVTGDESDELLRILKLEGRQGRALAIGQDRCIGLTFLPDGQALYYVLKNPREELGRLYRLKLGSEVPTTMVLENIDGPVTFSPDGKQFAFLRRAEERGLSEASILVGSMQNPAETRPILSRVNTQLQEQMAWSPRGDQIAAIAFPAQMDAPTQPSISLFSLDGRERKQFSTRDLRTLSYPVWLDRGRSLMFSGLPVGAQSKQKRLEQLHIATGQFHELPSALAFDGLSVTSDGSVLAAVSLDQRSSVWVAEGNRLDAPRRLLPQSEDIENLSWLGDDVIFPSSRSGNVSFWRIRGAGGVEPLAGSERCVQTEPAGLESESAVIYSSNCATGGDDFNIWRLNLDTEKRVQLTSGSNFDGQPDVSRDGRWIVYSSWPSNSPSVWKAPARGGTPVRVSAQQARYPFLSPDGQEIVCQIRELNGLWHVAILSFANGAVLRDFPDLPAGEKSPPVRWSPDGGALEYVSSQGAASNIWREPLHGGAARQLTASAEGNIIYFSWNLNGTKLAYIRGRADSDVMLFRRARNK
ncbi:MAG: protein kinase [Acidobacteriaceae bacterium]|nr:protein kinase [Acidobacteriaceae bacterium]